MFCSAWTSIPITKSPQTQRQAEWDFYSLSLTTAHSCSVYINVGHAIWYFIIGSRTETVNWVFFCVGKLVLVMNEQECSSEQKLHVENIFYRNTNISNTNYFTWLAWQSHFIFLHHLIDWDFYKLTTSSHDTRLHNVTAFMYCKNTIKNRTTEKHWSKKHASRTAGLIIIKD